MAGTKPTEKVGRLKNGPAAGQVASGDIPSRFKITTEDTVCRQRLHNTTHLNSNMLDRKFIVDNVELVKQNCANRGAKADVDRLLALDHQRREKQTEVEQLNRQANEVSKSIGQAKDPRRA